MEPTCCSHCLNDLLIWVSVSVRSSVFSTVGFSHFVWSLASGTMGHLSTDSVVMWGRSPGKLWISTSGLDSPFQAGFESLFHLSFRFPLQVSFQFPFQVSFWFPFQVSFLFPFQVLGLGIFKFSFLQSRIGMMGVRLCSLLTIVVLGGSKTVSWHIIHLDKPPVLNVQQGNSCIPTFIWFIICIKRLFILLNLCCPVQGLFGLLLLDMFCSSLSVSGRNPQGSKRSLCRVCGGPSSFSGFTE